MTYEEKEKWENVAYRMDDEGFHYCFARYSSFEEIKDPEFHRLREAYLQSADKLRKYVGAKNEEEIDEE